MAKAATMDSVLIAVLLKPGLTPAETRCRCEIARCLAELRRGDPDVPGLVRGLVDWVCELRAIQGEPVQVPLSIPEQQAACSLISTTSSCG